MDPSLQQATLLEYTGQRSSSSSSSSSGSGQDVLPHGCPHGRGRAVFRSGQEYDGEWREGRMHGQGCLTWPDGVTWEGSMCANSINGRGVYRWGSAVYEGEVRAGLRHGHGTLRFTDSPVVYEGGWRGGLRHGRGALYYNAERTASYDGEWLDDMKHGQGSSTYPSGNSYVGAWARDQQEGRGTMTWLDRGQSYTGQWAAGRPHGLGEHTWWRTQQQRQGSEGGAPGHAVHVMLNRYEGMFEAGQRHGEGVLHYSNGARYEGQWRAGLKHGGGVYVFEDGTVFDGPFRDDRPDLAAGVMLGAESTFAGQRPGSSAGAGGSSSSAGGSGSTRSSARGTLRSAAGGGEARGATGAAKPQGAAGPPGGRKGSAGPRPSRAAPAAAKAGPRSGANAAAAGAGATAGRAPSKPGTPPAAPPAASTAPDAAAAAAGAGPAAGPGLGPPGFGPPVYCLQLYIADLLREYGGDPGATYRAVVNLLVMHNTELRCLYDKYSAQLGPFTSAASADGSMSVSWALRAGQLWELLRDARLLCGNVQLRHACQLLQQATTPPPAVLKHRQQVMLTADAGAVTPPLQPRRPYDPDAQLLFRDFCELLVRLAAARYRGLPGLEQQLQHVLSGHLLPLLGSGGGASGGGGGSRQLAGGARAPVLSASTIASAAAGGAGATAGGRGRQAAPKSPAASDSEVLAAAAPQLRQLFAAIARTGSPDPAGAQAAAGLEPDSQRDGCSEPGCDDEPWLQRAVSVRQVLLYLQAAGVLDAWQLAPQQVARALLHDALAPCDPWEARACIEDPSGAADPEPPVSSSGDGNGCPAAPAPDLLFWMDCGLLLPEVAWGLARLAADLHASSRGDAAAAAAAGADAAGPQHHHQQLLDAALHALLLGERGVLLPFVRGQPEPADGDCGSNAALDEGTRTAPERGDGRGATAELSWQRQQSEAQHSGGSEGCGEGALSPACSGGVEEGSELDQSHEGGGGRELLDGDDGELDAAAACDLQAA